MKGHVQRYSCTRFSAMTWIYSPHSVFSFNWPGNPYLNILWKRFSMHSFRKIFFFFFLKTVLLKNYFAWLLLSTAIHAKALLWKGESFVLVTGSSVMTWSMRLSSLYKLLLPSYLSCYLSFLPHCKGWWHKTRSDTSLEINQKLQSAENNAGDKAQIINRIRKLRFYSKPLCCSTLLLSIRGFMYSSLGGKGHPP